MATAALYLPQLRMDVATILARAQAADAGGFHSVWFMDHLAAPMAPDFDAFEGWTIATAVAARTERIRIGHLVLCDAFRHPALLAKMAATLDHISGGRLELGIGWGSVPEELRRWGITSDGPAARAARLTETLEVLEALFTGEPVSYDGTYVTLDDVTARPVPVQRPLPVHIGGGGERLTMPLVRRFADWWNCPAYALDRLDTLRPLAGDRARISVQHPVGLAASSAERDDVVATTTKRFGSWGGVIAGTPDEVAAALAAEAAAGVELFICQLHDFGRPETIDLFAREVLPALA